MGVGRGECKVFWRLRVSSSSACSQALPLSRFAPLLLVLISIMASAVAELAALRQCLTEARVMPDLIEFLVGDAVGIASLADFKDYVSAAAALQPIAGSSPPPSSPLHPLSNPLPLSFACLG